MFIRELGRRRADADRRREEVEGPHLRRRPRPQARRPRPSSSSSRPWSGSEIVQGARLREDARDLRRHLRLRADVRLPPRRGPLHHRGGPRPERQGRGPRLDAARAALRRPARRSARRSPSAATSYTVVGVMERKEFYWNSANDNAPRVDERVRVRPRHHHAQPHGGRPRRARRWPTSTCRSATSRRWTRPWTRSTRHPAPRPRRGRGLPGLQPRRPHAADGGAGQDLRHHVPRLRHDLAPRGRDRDHEHPARVLQRAGARGRAPARPSAPPGSTSWRSSWWRASW